MLNATPPAPAGWQLIRYYLDGRPPEPDPLTSGRGRSRAWCQRMATAWRASCYNQGEFELSIEPAGGWGALGADPLQGIVYGLADGSLPPQAALAQLRKMFDERSTQHASDQPGRPT